MPSVRFSRDKRGYEYIYLVHTPVKRGKPGRTRVLYWYRTPPGVRVGRKPFDEDVQRLIEQQHPDLTFDWETIIGTPMPPPDMTEFWRERRRLEKAARQERRAEEAAEQAQRGAASAADHASAPEPEHAAAEGADGGDDPLDSGTPSEDENAQDEESVESEGTIAAPEGSSAAPPRRRRRRRGRRPGPAGGPSGSGSQTS